MMNKIKKMLLCISALLLVNSLVAAVPQDDKKVIKLAIMDNPLENYSDGDNAAETYAAYKQGIAAGVAYAAANGYHIVPQYFLYDSNLMDVIEKIPEVKAWSPDVVVGLHNSNQFLILRNYFYNTLILSLFASATSGLDLSSNFYSLGIDDQTFVDELASRIAKFYPGHAIFLICEVDNKSSVTVAKQLKEWFRQHHQPIKIKTYNYVKEDFNQIDKTSLLHEYEDGDIIIDMSSVFQNFLRISEQIFKSTSPHVPKLYTGADNWGGNRVSPAYSDSHFKSYSITSYSFYRALQDQLFTQYFQIANHHRPSMYISYQTFRSIQSIVDALKKYPTSSGEMSEQILRSYRLAVAANRYWFKSQHVLLQSIQRDPSSKFNMVQEQDVNSKFE